jgi:hypothetical protein
MAWRSRSTRTIPIISTAAARPSRPRTISTTRSPTTTQ